MLSTDVRASFLRYFETRGHRVVPSSSLVPHGDPTLFFTNAGMNQFKDVFTGRATRDYVRAATCQKCMRVSGKHNDFETVGRSLRHHTFFEMLGNFSFGDYFKAEAIQHAWRLLTEEWRLDPDRLVATVFEEDDEAERIWRNDIGVDRVFRLGASENYWSMGETGPNGPCSEIHLDSGPGSGCGRPDCDPSCACDRYLEIWNLVFMQFDKDAAGNVTRLPKPSIDTGMGLERVSAILQGTVSNYDTDLFAPILSSISSRSGVAYRRVGEGESDEAQVSMRVVADHARAITLLLADGVVPTNEGRGYVLRKLLRRAAGHASRIGLQAPFLSELTGVVASVMAPAYPDLRAQAAAVAEACAREEASFARTLQEGSVHLEGVLRSVKEKGLTEVPGADAFFLHDTYGFPLEFTVELAQAAGLSVDRAGFDEALKRQQARARAAAKTTAVPSELPQGLRLAPTEFRGYQETTTEGCTVQALVVEGQRVPRLDRGAEGWLVLDRTPFYAESGGQVGDAGVLTSKSGARLAVTDTQSLAPGVTGHRVRVETGDVAEGAVLSADVDAPRRRRIMANHTATHLLHRALKDVLGEGAKQAGSLVAPDRLRFDFNWHQPLTRDQLDAIERLVNDRVFAHEPVAKKSMAYQEALDGGAVAMFGEKYGDTVRVVSVGDWSVELCGGTHCDRTDQIGGIRIVTERGVASGIRRIEALTGPGLVERLVEDERLLAEAEELLRAPRADVLAAIQKMAEQTKALRRELDETRRQVAKGGEASQGTQSVVGDFRLETRRLPSLDVAELRGMIEGLREKAGVHGLLLGSERDGKAALVLSLAPALVERLGGEPAREIVVELAKDVGGGGGGRGEMGWAGGRRPENLEAAAGRLPEIVARRLGAQP